jgi:hypothetical protein
MSTPAAPAPPQFKNRRWLLITAGVVELLMALGALGMIALFTVATAMSDKQGPPPPPGMNMAFVQAFIAVFYGAIAAFLITVGIGSILAKNWARIAGLIAAWFWLAMGVIGTLTSALIMPAVLHQVQQQSQGPPVPPLFFAIFFTVIAAFYVGVPLAFVLIYSNKHVRMTCLAASGRMLTEQTAAQPIGTTRQGYPIAVGILVGWLTFGVLIAIPTLLFMSRPYPFFGRFLHGAPAIAVGEVMVLINGYFIWELYKLRPLGWWGTLVVHLVYPLSAAITIFRYGMHGYLLAIIPDLESNPAYRIMGSFISRMFPVLIWIGPAIIFVYLLCIRRYFQEQPPAAAAAAPAL